MRFWDASAVVPLLVAEPARPTLLRLLKDDPVMLVWWATPVECASALARRERDGTMESSAVTGALTQLRSLTQAWEEVTPTESVRTRAGRLLRVHDLRAADSLQLAAALTVAEDEPATLEFLSLDDRLREAAEREGFQILRV